MVEGLWLYWIGLILISVDFSRVLGKSFSRNINKLGIGL